MKTLIVVESRAPKHKDSVEHRMLKEEINERGSRKRLREELQN